jgi:hypothetical protein
MTHAPVRSIRAVRLAALAAALTALTAPVAGAQRSPPIRRALPLAPDGSVRVYVLSGRVSVVGGDVDSVIVTGTAPARQPFHMGGGPRGVKLGVWDETATGSVAPADLEVRVPRRARVWVKAGQTADVDVREVTGGLDVNIVAGTVRVRGAPRELNVEAMDGSVEIVGSPAWMRVKTASGAITLRGGSEDVALSSVSGAIRVSGGRVTRGRFENVTGDIRFDAAPDRGGALTFDTHGGLVELRLPRDVAADFEVTTIRGTIENALSTASPVAGRDARGRALSFSIGTTPAATITVRSFKGRVALRAQ